MKEQSVLVVDDDAGMRELLKSVLTSEKYIVYTAYGGEDGVKQALALSPDLIVLDLLMPRMNGAAVCKALRADKKTATIPILLATGTQSTDQIQDSVAIGADDFVSKPIDTRDLLIRVRAMLRCKEIVDPAERYLRYTELVREATANLHLPGPPGGLK